MGLEVTDGDGKTSGKVMGLTQMGKARSTWKPVDTHIHNWFHLDCIGMTIVPEDDWYCMICRFQKEKQPKIKTFTIYDLKILN